MQNHCVVPNCSAAKSDPQPLFRFPLDAERCKKWVEKCQRQDLADKSPDQLYKYYRLCGKHFKPSCIDSDSQTTALKEDAEPTIFDAPSQPQNGQGKRGNETTKDDESPSKGRKRIKKSPTEQTKEDVNTTPKTDEHREYLKALFEVLLLLGQQNIPPSGPADDKADTLVSRNFEALLEYRLNCGHKELKEKHEANQECCSLARLNQLIEVSELCIRNKLTEEVRQHGFFSLITDDLVNISGRWYLPVFLRYVDHSNRQRQRFFGLLSFEGEGDELAERLLSELTDKWGLDMEQCRGQAHSCSGTHHSKIRTFAAKVMEKFPLAVLALRSTCALNISLAGGMALSGVRLVMRTFKKIESFFRHSPSLTEELENAISIFYPDKEDKASELKEICRDSWTRRNDAFDVALEILEALLLCVDSVHDNEDMRWSDQVTHDALEISKALVDFEFIMTLIVLKNTMTLTRALGTNLQGSVTDTHFAAGSLQAVQHSLKEVFDNIDVYHEFWTEEAVNLAAVLEVPVKIPRSFLKKHRSEPESVEPKGYYKKHLSVPVVSHMMKEISELFSEEHLKTLRCLSLVPTVIEHQKSAEPVEDNVQVFKNDIPNAGTLSAELHCWWVKWSKRGKGETLPSGLHQTLQLADVKFFPNMLAIMRRISTLPTLALEDGADEASKRFQMYLEDTPESFKSKSLALLHVNNDVSCDLDSMVEEYLKIYPDKDTSS